MISEKTAARRFICRSFVAFKKAYFSRLRRSYFYQRVIFRSCLYKEAHVVCPGSLEAIRPLPVNHQDADKFPIMPSFSDANEALCHPIPMPRSLGELCLRQGFASRCPEDAREPGARIAARAEEEKRERKKKCTCKTCT